MKLEKERARTNSEVKEGRRKREKQILLFESRLYYLKHVHMLDL